MNEPIETPTPSPEAGPGRLMNKNFVLLWQGQLVSQLGTQAFNVAMMFWVKHATGSASLLGFLMMAAALPGVLLGPIGGTFADRHSRRRIIVFGDLLRGVAVVSLAVLVFRVPEQTGLILGWLLVVAMLNGIVDAFFRPAVTASIPDIVPDHNVPAANSLNKMSSDATTFIGQAVGGVAYRLLGPWVLFLVDGLTYLFSGVSETFITIPQKIAARPKGWAESFASFRADLKAGLAYVWQTPGTRSIVLLLPLFNALLVPVMVLFPFYVEDHLGVQSDWFGYLVAGFAAGALVGSLLAGAIAWSGRQASALTLGSGLLYGLAAAGLGLVSTPWAALGLAATVGILNGFMNVRIVTALQRTTPSELRGRVFGLMETLVFSLTPIAMGLSGIIADLTGQNIPGIFVACGAIVTLLATILAANAAVRQFLAVEKKVGG